MASEQVSAAEVLQNAMSGNIPSTIQTISQQNGEITTISTSALPETMASTEAMMATESISEASQGASATLSAQEIVESIPQVQQHDSVTGSQESLVISAENVAIATTASLDTSPQMASLSANYPWAARLHDCELIGDSYRGYVTNEVELDLILTLHKQHTNSCWGTRQSPSSAKPSIRLMWKSQYVPYDGIPFLNTGRRATVMECQYGPRRKGAVNKKQVDFDEHGNAIKRHRPTCPARIYVKKVRKFPEFRIDPNLEGKNVRQAQERALTALRLAGVHVGGEERYYVQLPLPIAHEYHDMDDIPMDPEENDSQGQRLNPEVMHKIRELVARGVSGIYTVKHCLKEYVEKELFANMEPPPRHNKSYFPTIIDIQNHIHQAQMALATGTLVPLPPLTNLPSSSPQLKEKTRKRKHGPEKLSQSSQTTAEAVASIQQHYQPARLTTQDQEQLIQQTSRENYQGNEAHQLEIIQGTEGQAAEVDISNQPQILITQGSGSGRDEGQVVIVVNASSFFSGQSDSDTPTTLSLTIPASQVASLSHASLHSGTGAQAVTFIPQQTDAAPQTTGSTTTPQTVAFIPQSLDNSRGAVAFLTSQQTDNTSQVPVSAAYLAAHGQSNNILSMLDSALQASSGGTGAPVIRVGTNLGAVQIADGSQTSDAVPGQVLATQAAVEAVLSAATSRGEIKQTTSVAVSVDGEPQHKRQALEVDYTSLLKGEVFHGQQAQGQGGEEQNKSTTSSEQSQMVSIPTSAPEQGTESIHLTSLPQTSEGRNFISVDTAQPVVMVTDSVLQSMQDGGQGISTSCKDNNQSLLKGGEDNLSAQDNQLATHVSQIAAQGSHLSVQENQYYAGSQQTNAEHQLTEAQHTATAPSSQVPFAAETVQGVSVSIGTSEGVPVSMETSQVLPVSMEAASEETKEHVTARENCLKVSEGEQSVQEYNTQSSCGETAGNEQYTVSLMFESGQQLTQEETPVVSHANAFSTVNNTPAVFTQ